MAAFTIAITTIASIHEDSLMRIGVPSETKTLEGRVALVPAACADLVHRGHEVYVQAGAGQK
ncbi:MAG: hypothetical protein ACREPX_00975, partial [Rhodanobacteraceae bacterium]